MPVCTSAPAHRGHARHVRCQRERLQSQNRLIARVDLCDKLEAKLSAAKLEVRSAVEKKKRQSRKRPRGLKERILETKHKRSEVKKQRGRVRDGS